MTFVISVVLKQREVWIKMVTYNFTNGTPADADEVNQNFEDVEEDILNGDVFTYVSTSDYSSTGTTPADVLTITINKPVDMLHLSFGLFTSDASHQARMDLYKNGIIIAFSDIKGYTGGVGTPELFIRPIGNYIVVSQTPVTTRIGVGFYINSSFSIGDTLVFTLSNQTATYVTYLNDLVIKGINNKSTDTTWVTAS